MDEMTLIRTAREGDHDAFRALFDAHHGRIFGLAYHYLKNLSDAEDVLQETFIRAHRFLGTYDPGRGQGFGVWINRICIHCSIDALRKARRRNSEGLEEKAVDTLSAQAPGDDPERVARSREIRANIDRALERLSPRQRMIFAMRHDMGFTTREIAASIGATEGSVKTHLFRAVDALKKRLRRFVLEDGYGL